MEINQLANEIKVKMARALNIRKEDASDVKVEVMDVLGGVIHVQSTDNKGNNMFWKCRLAGDDVHLM